MEKIIGRKHRRTFDCHVLILTMWSSHKAFDRESYYVFLKKSHEEAGFKE